MSGERLLGQLLANQKNLHEDVIEIKKDVKALNEFRWKWLGKMAAYSGIIATFATVIVEYILFNKRIK